MREQAGASSSTIVQADPGGRATSSRSPAAAGDASNTGAHVRRAEAARASARSAADQVIARLRGRSSRRCRAPRCSCRRCRTSASAAGRATRSTSTRCRATTSTSCARGRRACSTELRDAARARRRQQRPAEPRAADVARDRPRHRRRASASRRRLIDDTLYDAFGQRQVSTIYTPLNQYHVVHGGRRREFWQSPEALQDIYVQLADRRAGAAVARSRATRPTTTPLAVNHQGQFPAVDALVQPRRRASSLGEAVERDRGAPSARSACRPRIRGSFQGTAQAFQASLASQPLLILAALRRRLHRARHALRELRPPDHDPLDAAVGGRRRAARAAAVPDRPQHHRAHRHHPADRHREEERDHDDRLRADAERREGKTARTRSIRPACCASGRS